MAMVPIQVRRVPQTKAVWEVVSNVEAHSRQSKGSRRNLPVLHLGDLLEMMRQKPPTKPGGWHRKQYLGRN